MDEIKIEFFKKSLKEARTLFDQEKKELIEAEARTFWLKDDLAKLKRTITALAAMCSVEPWIDELGITESCEEVMALERSEVSTGLVVKRLEGMGFDFSSTKNPSASVHSILSRLATKGKIKKITDEAGAVTWRGPHYEEPADDFAQSAEISDDDIPF
jgi:hypothetical protein